MFNWDGSQGESLEARTGTPVQAMSGLTGSESEGVKIGWGSVGRENAKKSVEFSGALNKSVELQLCDRGQNIRALAKTMEVDGISEVHSELADSRKDEVTMGNSTDVEHSIQSDSMGWNTQGGLGSKDLAAGDVGDGLHQYGGDGGGDRAGPSAVERYLDTSFVLETEINIQMLWGFPKYGLPLNEGVEHWADDEVERRTAIGLWDRLVNGEWRIADGQRKRQWNGGNSRSRVFDRDEQKGEEGGYDRWLMEQEKIMSDVQIQEPLDARSKVLHARNCKSEVKISRTDDWSSSHLGKMTKQLEFEERRHGGRDRRWFSSTYKAKT
ncbi:hypothetical protein B0H10DRAFT_1967576 [Mycena sp. CBHHK59/15]|nr:hypothetical protein B0H10DRAFT_1967576 [Mycena sp. CBHHK59/15]